MTNTALSAAQTDTARLQRLRGYLQQDPRNATLLADALGSALQLRDHDAAAALAAHAEQLQVLSPTLAAQLCVHHLQSGNVSSALDYGRAALAQGADSPAMRYNTAWAAHLCGAFDESLQHLLQAFPQASAGTLDACILVARNLHHLDRCDEASARLTAVLQQQDDATSDALRAEALGLRALLASDVGNRDAARSDARLALALLPGQADALLALADTQKEDGDFPAAAGNYTRAVQGQAHCPRGWSGLAQIHLAELSLDDAETCAQTAVAQMGEHIGSWHVLGWIHILKGNTGAARTAFDNAMTLDRNFADTHGSLAVLDAMAGDRTEAQRRIRVAERLDRQSLALQYARLLLLQQDEDADGSRALVRDVLARQAPASTQSGQTLVERRISELIRTHALH